MAIPVTGEVTGSFTDSHHRDMLRWFG